MEGNTITEFEKLGSTYRQAGDYFLPDLKISSQEDAQIGIWGQRHRRYLKEHHRVRYYNLLTAGALNGYLAEVESRAQALFDTLVRKLSEEENLTEKLKTSDLMEWVRRSNSIRNRATEIVNAEVIFV